MNRRSFITKALVGLAVVPVLAKLGQAQPRTCQDAILADGPLLYWRLDEAPGFTVLANGPELYSIVWYSNPKTGKPWTEADLNSAEFSIPVSSASS